jgi:hypothetical protein
MRENRRPQTNFAIGIASHAPSYGSLRARILVRIAGTLYLL